MLQRENAKGKLLKVIARHPIEFSFGASFTKSDSSYTWIEWMALKFHDPDMLKAFISFTDVKTLHC
jgi:hypothetical protein